MIKVKILNTNTNNTQLAQNELNKELEDLQKNVSIKQISMNLINNQIVFLIQYENNCNS